MNGDATQRSAIMRRSLLTRGPPRDPTRRRDGSTECEGTQSTEKVAFNGASVDSWAVFTLAAKSDLNPIQTVTNHVHLFSLKALLEIIFKGHSNECVTV